MSPFKTRHLISRLLAALLIFSIMPLAAAQEAGEFGAAVVIIELTDEDIELQVFVDGFDYTRVVGTDSQGERFLDMKAKGRLWATGGLSEVFFASEPSHFLIEEDNFDEFIEDFLARWPEGVYSFEGMTPSGVRLEGEALLTHVLPDLPEIVAPLPDGEDPPEFAPGDELLIDWEPVTTCFEGLACDVEIIEYQVILEQAEPERVEPWVDGSTRRALINLPADVTEVAVPPQFMVPGEYEFEILAIESSGNSTISVGEFEISEEE